MQAQKKVTLLVPVDLLNKAQKATGEGITPTVRQGLELIAAAPAYKKLRNLRGKVSFSVDWKSLRGKQ